MLAGAQLLQNRHIGVMHSNISSRVPQITTYAYAAYQIPIPTVMQRLNDFIQAHVDWAMPALVATVLLTGLLLFLIASKIYA